MGGEAHETRPAAPAPRLRREVGHRELFALAFGAIIGVGWITIVGIWLQQAGALGALLAFAGGGLIILCIGLCYAEAAAMLPVSGGEVAYAYEMYGLGAAFMTGWFIALAYISVASFEVISVGWVLGNLFDGFDGPVLYHALGEPVYAGRLAAGLILMVIIAGVNYRGVKLASRFQDLMAFALIAITLVFVAAGLWVGRLENLEPLFAGATGWQAAAGVLVVLATAPFWFSGFDVIPQAMGEKSAAAPLHLTGRVIAMAILAALVFYVLVILATAMVLPRAELLALDLPAAGAFEAAFASPFLARLVLLAGFLGLITSWNAVFFAASRVLYALGRAHILPAFLGRVHPTHGTPSGAILFVAVIGTLGGLLGRGAIVPIVNASGASLAVIFGVICLGVLRLRRREPDRPRPYRAPGGAWLPVLASLFAAAMAIVALHQAWAHAKMPVPLEWAVLLGWLALGAIFWRVAGRRRRATDQTARRALVLMDMEP